MTPTKTDPDKLRQQAADLAERSAAAQAKVAEQQAAERARLDKHQIEYDRALVESYRAADHEAAVEQARADLDAAVADLPVTQALARYLAAQVTRYDAHTGLIGARGRLGMPTAGSQPPPVADVLPVSEYIHRVAVQIADQAITQQREDNHRNRNGTETP